MRLSSNLIAETTFSSPVSLIILTPCVLRPAILISLTAVLITQGVRIIKLTGDEKVVSAIKLDDNLI